MNERLLQDVEALATLLNEGGWQELRVTSNALNVLLSHDSLATLSGPGAAELPPTPTAPTHQSKVEAVRSPGPAPAVAPNSAVAEPTSVDAAWHPVVAPNLGTFYRSPKPGAPPFVELGQVVTAGTEICLLEVMKLFTSVFAGVSGKVAKICAADAELVEGGQVLFYIARD